MLVRHILIPFRSADVFFKAFTTALNIARENGAKLTVANVINSPLGVGMDEALIMDVVSREYRRREFYSVLSKLEGLAKDAGVTLDSVVLDGFMPAARTLVNYAAQNAVDMMVIGTVKKVNLKKIIGTDIADEMIDLNPPCSIIIVE